VIEMVVVKTEETLHNYLRRHFEKISEGKARQFAEQGERLKKGVVSVPRSSDGKSQRN
jgi:hypothetical protein